MDPFTGYRSYGEDQVQRARLIAALRGIGMGLARIRTVCDLDPASAALEVRSWWRQEEADAISRSAAVRALLDSLVSGDINKETAMTDAPVTPGTRPAIASMAARSEQGPVRSVQEDAALARDLAGGWALLAVADGFHDAGDLAERALDALAARLDRLAADGVDPLGALTEAWAAVGAMIRPDESAGLALTAAVLAEGRVHVAHVGDARVLLVRGERIEQLTQDHTLVRSLVAAGRLSADEAAEHPDRATLNRALAAGMPTDPDLLVRTLEKGDLLLLCTDGIHAVVPTDDVAATLTGGRGVQGIVDDLCERALGAGGPDNLSVAATRLG